jgi:hypothetical protein
MGTTSRFSVGRDSLIRQIFESDFFDKVPQLEDLRPLFETCRETYKSELEKKGCSCRMTTAWAKNCVTPTLDRIEASKKTDHDLIRNFIRYIGKYSPEAEVDHVGVTIIYDKTYDIFVDTDGEATELEHANIQSDQL